MIASGGIGSNATVSDTAVSLRLEKFGGIGSNYVADDSGVISG